MRIQLGALVALLAVPAFAQEPPVHVHFATGAAVVLSGESDAAVTPTAEISARGPLVFGGTKDGKGHQPFGFRADLRLTGLTAETLTAGRVEAVKAIELAVGLERVIGRLGDGDDAVRTSLGISGGFATTLPHDPAPLDHYARWAAAVVRLSQGDNYFEAGLASDQRLDGTYQPAALIAGQVALPALKNAAGDVQVAVVLKADAILGLQVYAGAGARRDVVRFQVQLGR